MEIFIAILCGLFLGGANVIPGVSGGTVAVMLGIYEKLVGNISDIIFNLKGRKWKELLGNITFLLPIFIGTALGIILFSSIISFALENYFEITMYSFLGLILGSLPSLISKVGLEKSDSALLFIPMAITFIIALILSVASISGFVGASVESAGILFLFVCGIIASSAMIVPGISGSFLLMIIGIYTLIVDTAANLLDFSLFWQNISVLAPFGIGILIGLIVVAKIMDTLLKKHYKATFLAVIGFVIGSLPVLCVNLSLINPIFAIVACVLFAIISFLLMKIKKTK